MCTNLQGREPILAYKIPTFSKQRTKGNELDDNLETPVGKKFSHSEGRADGLDKRVSKQLMNLFISM